MYPKKGAIRLGSDGDVTIVDMNKEATIDPNKLHSKNKPTPWGGWKVKGMPVYTIVRGNVQMKDGEPVGKVDRPDADADHQLIGAAVGGRLGHPAFAKGLPPDFASHVEAANYPTPSRTEVYHPVNRECGRPDPNLRRTEPSRKPRSSS